MQRELIEAMDRKLLEPIQGLQKYAAKDISRYDIQCINRIKKAWIAKLFKFEHQPCVCCDEIFPELRAQIVPIVDLKFIAKSKNVQATVEGPSMVLAILEHCRPWSQILQVEQKAGVP